MKKALIFTLLLISLSLILAACTNGGDTSSSTDSTADTSSQSSEPSESTEASTNTDSKVYAKEIIVTEGFASSVMPYSIKDPEPIKALTEMLENCSYTPVEESVIAENIRGIQLYHKWLHFMFEDSRTEPLFSSSFHCLKYDGKFYIVEGFDYDVWSAFKSEGEYVEVDTDWLMPEA